MLYAQNVIVHVYVHQQGKLLRSVATEGARSILSQDEKSEDTLRIIGIQQVEIFRKRDNGQMQCDQQLENEDEYRILRVIENVGCIPTFWGQFRRWINICSFKKCSSYSKNMANLKKSLHYYQFHQIFYF